MPAPTNDMFGLPTPTVTIPPEESAPSNDNALDEPFSLNILQIIPADGWRAAFVDATLQPDGIRLLGLACFALVEIEMDTGLVRQVQPMVADETGEIGDVETFDDFICVVPPGRDVGEVVDFTRAQQAEQAAGDDQEE